MGTGLFGVFLTLSLLALTLALTPATYISEEDRARYRKLFQPPYSADLEMLSYAVKGAVSQGDDIGESQKACDLVKKLVNVKDVTSLFHAAVVIDALKSKKVTCQVSLADAENTLKAAITSQSTSQQLYHTITASALLGYKVDSSKASAALESVVQTDDSPLSYAYVFYAASHLSGDLKKFHSMIEDIVAQADEVGDSSMQFEAGFYTTALVLDASYRLATAAKTAPTISEDKVMKFVNYLLSRKHTVSVRDAAALLSAMSQFTTNKFHVPLTVSLASSVSVSEKNPIVQIRASNVMGQSLGKITVTAETARHQGDDAVIMSKKQLTANSKDSSLFDLDLMKAKPAVGFYRIVLSVAAPAGGVKLIGSTGIEVEVKVTTQVSVEDVDVSVVDKDQASDGRAVRVPPNGKISAEADHHQRLIVRFNVKDKKKGESMTAHQAFVRLYHQKAKREVIFYADKEPSGIYRLDLDIGAKAKSFNYLSGLYDVTLIVGDVVIENPVAWTIADIKLKFSDDSPVIEEVTTFAKKPEIKHMFREPEKRPPTLVSNLFTGLVLVPLLLLFILWIRIGANISNFSFSLSAVGFHIGMGCIFVLYLCYFLQLNMFTTLRYLAVIGLPTFLCGNKMLSAIAAKKKK